jgi:hypothetical protein
MCAVALVRKAKNEKRKKRKLSKSSAPREWLTKLCSIH